MIVSKMPTKRSSGSRADSMRTSFNQYLSDFGTTVTILSKTEVKDSMGRVTSISESSTTAKADIQWVSKKDLLHLNVGDVKVGDGMIFFKYNQTINLHDELTFNGRTWRIVEQIEGEVVAGDVVYTGYIIRENA
jgi:hypothetical protein